MKNVFKSLFSLLFIASMVTSCDVGDDKELDYGNGAFVTQFPYAEKVAFFLKDENFVIYDYTVPVQLVGGNGLALSTDTNVTFEKLAYVDDSSTDADDTYVTAVEGVDFDFVNESNVLTIPAGSTFATIPIKVYSENLDDTHPPVLVLNLTEVSSGNTNIVNSGNKSKINVILQAQCPSDLAGSYTNVTTRLSPAGGPYTWTAENITEVGTGQYQTTNFGQYYAGGNPPGTGSTAALDPSASGLIFTEVCGRVFVATQQLGQVYSNISTQSPTQYAASSVDIITGVITIEYSIWFTSNTVERKYRSVYTPN